MNRSVTSLTYLHPGDLSLLDWVTFFWYWLGIPIAVFVGIYLLAKIGKWLGRPKDNSDSGRQK
jgi:uncharacterized membrane protein YfcA